MKILFISLVITFVAAVHGFGYRPPKITGKLSSVETWGIHNAKVDNFDPNNTATYEQRYLSNLEFARDQNPPIILYVGGEWEINVGELGDVGQLWHIAKENEGALYYLEHRFYGKSFPKADFATENLKLLTGDQAQADLLSFIKLIKSRPQFANSKVVLFGCSYSATLVTWVRHDHPDEVDMIYATSGPQHATADMNTYADKSSLVLNTINPQCASMLKEASQQLLDMYDEPNGTENVRKLFNYCDPFKPNPHLDKMSVFYDMFAFWGTSVQSSLPEAITKCSTLVNDSVGTSLEKYVRLRIGNRTECVPNDYNSNLVSHSHVTPDPTSPRPFFYQRCTSFGLFVTTTKNSASPNLIFAPNQVLPEYYHNLCYDAFSNTITKQDTEAAIEYTNSHYGGYYPDVTNAVFVYGSLDPWQQTGVPNSYNNNIVYNVASAGHCHDMYAPSPNDDEYMKPVKEGVRAQLQKWLNE